MSDDAYAGRSGGAYLLWVWVGIPAAALLILILVMLFGTPKDGGVEKPKEGEYGGQELASVRPILGKSPDLASCKAVVGRLNAHLRQAKIDPPALSDAEKASLKKELGLTDAELAELASPTFTPLDAYHIEGCILLRDAAASLEVQAPPGKDGRPVRLTPLELAEAAFAWTCRQVRLAPGDVEPAPVSFVLRRGWGNSIERALVFVALLEQFGLEEGDKSGLQGCILTLPREGGGARIWGCGVAVGDKPDGLYLFDTRMGLPVPGPKGVGIATLAQAAADATVLTQLDAGKDSKDKYDVTLAQAKEAKLFVLCPLSSAAPRMRLLQDTLLRERAFKDKALPAAVRVKLAETPASALGPIRMAAGPKADVSFLPGGASSLRRGVPADEGGSDEGVPFQLGALPGFVGVQDRMASFKMPRSKILELAAVPWQYFPQEFNERDLLRFDRGVGGALRSVFAAPFTRAQRDPASPREQMLRGRVGKTTSEQLVKERDHWHNARQRGPEARMTREEFDRWKDVAREADLLQARADAGTGDATQARQAMQAALKGVGVLISNAIAEPRAADLTYQMGLCMHERAIRSEMRAMLAARSGVALPDEKQRARDGFEAAAGWWSELLKLFPNDLSATMGRRLWGEALMRLGQPAEARKTWNAAGQPATDIERLGDLWLARRP